MGRRGEGYVLIQFLLFALIAFGPESLPFLPAVDGVMQQFLQPLGFIIGVVGLLLIGAGLINLGDNLTPYPHPKSESKHVEHGAYRIVRHPIYSGLVFAAVGWSLWKGSLAMLCYSLILLLFFDIKSRREETWLREKFSTYANYQQRVRKLIPFVY